MKLGSLISGGKDSIYSIFSAERGNHEVVTLLGIKSHNPDSWMFHTQNIDLIELQAEAMKKPIIVNESKGEKEKELEDLEKLIEKSISQHGIEGILVGAIESSYQRERVEKVCDKLGIELVAPLWKTDHEEYMDKLIENDFKVMITKVAAQGFDKEWLGRFIDSESLSELKDLKEKYRIHLAGEGGEYETLVLDCPLFKDKIEIKSSEVIWERNSGELNVSEAALVSKN